MSLTWNIVRKDLYRLRWILVLWVLVMACRLALVSIQSALDEEGFLPFYMAAWVFGYLFLPVISFGLVMGLLQDDPVSNPDAFWLTRPISGNRLLAAKSLSLGLLWLLPAVVTAPFWLSHGYSAGQLCQAALQTIAAQAMVTLLAFPFAAISPNTSRFVMNTILGAVALVISALLYRFSEPDNYEVNGEILKSRLLVLVSVATAMSVAVALIQFRTRRTRHSAAVLAVAAIAGLVTARCWPWDVVRDSARYEEISRVSALRLQYGSATLNPAQPGDSSSAKVVTVTYSIGGLRPGDMATAISAKHRLEWPGSSLSVESPPATTDSLAMACWAAAHGTGGNTTHAEFNLPKSRLDELLRAAPEYSAVVKAQVAHPEVAAELAIRIGEKSVRNGAAARIGDIITNGPNGLAIPLCESVPEFPDDALDTLGDPQPKAGLTEYYFLINREDGTILLAQEYRDPQVLDVATLRYLRTTLVFPTLLGLRQPNSPEFASWAKGKSIVKVVARDIDTLQRTVEVPRFEIKGLGAADAPSMAAGEP